MKYKTLLMGENNAVIDDFFLRMGDYYEIMTTSTRNSDIVKHLEVFNPDVFIYCINVNSYKDYNSIYFLKERLRRKAIPLVVIGSEEECKDFMKVTLDMADVILIKPLTADVITKKIDTFMKQWREEHAWDKETKVDLTQSLTTSSSAEKVEQKMRKHILVIDDDPMMLKLVNEQLHDSYDVATAISGKLALKFLEKKQTDLIILDYEMPVDNGPAVLKKLRENAETKDIPVVFLTGVSERERIQEVLLMRPQGYLLKPIDFDRLTTLIRGIIGQ